MRSFILLGLFIFSGAFSACSSSDQHFAVLSVRDGKGRKSPVVYREVSATVRITGEVAETTLEITFQNRSKRDLEVNLDLPLPQGATISRYALEVNGRMREGVIVEKQKGRVAFESTTRGNIDPGLLEKTKGNSFRTRIYPVPAGGTKRVLLSYLEPLRSGGGEGYRYNLPLSPNERIGEFSLTIAASHPETRVISLGKSRAEVREISLKSSATGRLSFEILSPRNEADSLVQIGPDGRRYFYLTDHHEIGEERSVSPEKVLLVWDASHSANQGNLGKEIALLDAYFRGGSETTVDLKILRDELASAGSFSVNQGEWSELKRVLQNIENDGATRLDRLDLRGVGYDEVIYVGDGLSTLGSGKCRWGKRPIFTINSSPLADHLLLSQLARKTHGAYLDLTRLSQEEALRRLTHEAITLQKVTGSGASDLILESDGGISTVRGRLGQRSTVLSLHYGKGGRTKFTRKVKVGQSGVPGQMAPKLWAQGRVDELGMAAKENRSAIIALAKKHRLVTSETSLIVLDRLEDYLTHGIVPPEAEMKKNYFKRLREREVRDGSQAADLDEVYESWKGIVDWHQGRRAKPIFTGGASLPAPMMVLPSMAPSPLGNIVTAGNRSGDFAINRNSIDAILNNPSRSASSSVTIKSWEPDTPYLRAYQAAQKAGDSLLPIYYEWKKKYHSSPGFYLESAEFFSEKNEKRLARRILSNLAELSAESPELLRILAHRYSQIGEDELAEMLFREVAEMRAEEPQSHRDLALALIELKRYREAERLLWKVISSEWDFRFEGVEMIALNEWNHLHTRHGSSLSLRSSQKRFRYRLDSDIRVLISWDTDNSDMDLWVTDPSGEKCYYANRLTKAGGRISNDFTDGRGPEEFMIRKAPAGAFKIQANYYGSREQTIVGPTTLHATVITNWGRRSEKRKHLTFRLGGSKEVVEIGEVEINK